MKPLWESSFIIYYTITKMQVYAFPLYLDKISKQHTALLPPTKVNHHKHLSIMTTISLLQPKHQNILDKT